jgi:hypothetical protein
MAVVAFALSVTAQPAAAQSAGGADVGKGGECGGQVPDANGVLTGAFISTTDSQVVSNNGGNVTLTCHFTLTPEQTPATHTRASGFTCGVGAAVTTDSRMAATPGGSATLTCKVTKKTTI